MSYPIILKGGPADGKQFFIVKLTASIIIPVRNKEAYGSYNYSKTDNYEIVDKVICIVYRCQ